jgi:hypothetical protein
MRNLTGGKMMKIIGIDTVLIVKGLCSTLFPIAAVLLLPSMQLAVFGVAATDDNADLLDKSNISDLFDIAGGVFAAILCTLSIVAYRKIKVKNMLMVSAAFGIFAIHAIVSRLDVFIPTIESSVLELIVSILIFVSLTFFFLAIVKRFKISERKTAPQNHCSS